MPTFLQEAINFMNKHDISMIHVINVWRTGTLLKCKNFNSKMAVIRGSGLDLGVNVDKHRINTIRFTKNDF